MMHATLQPGARLHLPWPSDFNAIVADPAGNLVEAVAPE